MYYILRNQQAFGPFLSRAAAFEYAAKQNWSFVSYTVKSDMAMQQDYLHLPIVKPN